VVRDAVGYSAERGDSVNVVNSAFSTPPAIEMETIPIWQQAWVLALVKPIMSAIVLLALIFGLMKPVLRRLAENSGQANNFSNNYGTTELTLAGAGGAAATEHPSGGLMLPNPDAGYENQLTAVKGLVAQDSERVAQVIKQWVAEEQ
jgi:flagellar M-ring protein FliF